MGSKGGRKVKGGGKSRTNKDHRHLCHTINKSRWDDICSAELKPDRYAKVLAKKTELDPDKPGLGQHYCVACRRGARTDSAPPLWRSHDVRVRVPAAATTSTRRR